MKALLRKFRFNLLILSTCLLSGQSLLSQPSCYNIVGYFPSWNGAASDIDYSKYSHIIYSFGIPNNDGTIGAIDNSNKLTDLVTRGHANNVKVLLSIGGWLNSSPDNTPFEIITNSSTSITQFTNSCANLITQYDLDGIDIDWEYPTSGTRWNNLITALDTKIHGMGKLLTAAVAESAYYGDNYNNVSVLDLVNIMSYGTYAQASAAITYWTGRGVPQDKRMLGVPFYGADNNSAEHIQKANLAKTSAGGIMIWEISSPGDISSIFTTLGNICTWTATEVKETKEVKKVQIFPTIATNLVTIENSLQTQCQLDIFDQLGNCIQTQEVNQGVNEIRVSNLLPGMYIFKVSNNTMSITQKIIKQ